MVKKPVFDNWEDAAKMCKYGKAVGRFRAEVDGRIQPVDLVKPLGRDGVVCYEGTGVVIRRATTREIDSITRWWTYS